MREDTMNHNRYLAVSAAAALVLALGACASGGTRSTDKQEGYFVERDEAVARGGVGNYVDRNSRRSNEQDNEEFRRRERAASENEPSDEDRADASASDDSDSVTQSRAS